MAFAVGSRSSLGFIAETTFGVTPTTPVLATLPVRSHSLNLTKERLTGADIQADRMLRTDRHGNKTVGGSIEVDLRKGDFDALLESAFFNSWATNTLKVGTTLKSLTIEDKLADITQHRLFTGMVVSSMSVNLAPNQMAQATFEMVGKDMTISGTSVSASDYTGSSTNEPFSADCKGSLKLGGSTVGYISTLEFSVNNDVTPAFALGSCEAQQLAYGMATVEGTLTAYMVDGSLLQSFIDEDSTSLEVEIDDPTGTNGYTWTMPKIKINSADVPLADAKERFVEMSFVALYDSVSGTVLQLDRNGA